VDFRYKRGGTRLKDIDEIDEKIISILKANARTPLSRISKEVGISKTAVKKRIDRLAREGIISRFTIELSSKVEVRALVLIRSTAKGKTSETSEIIARFPFVEKVYEVAGDYDIVAMISSPTVEKLNETIDKIREVPSVTSTITVMVLKTY